MFTYIPIGGLSVKWGMPELEELPPQLDAEVQYATRNNALSPAVVWKLRHDRLLREDGIGPPRAVPLTDIRSVQLEYTPTRPEPNRYRCRITLKNATRLEIFNRTYRGVYDFADTSDSYCDFVEGLHDALARGARECQFVAGSTALSYGVNIGVLILICAVVFGALAFFVMAGMLWVALIKILLILFYLPSAVKWVRRNKPRFYQPHAIPANMLPASG